VSLKLDQAQDADIPRLVELLGVLFAQEAELSPDPDKQRRALRMILAEPSEGKFLKLPKNLFSPPTGKATSDLILFQ
jgi:hypothetical protein